MCQAQGKEAAAEEAFSSSLGGIVIRSHTIPPPWTGGAHIQTEYTFTEYLLCAHPKSKHSHKQCFIYFSL